MIKIFTRLTIFLLIFSSLKISAQQTDYFETTKYLEIYFSLFKEINQNYVDPVSPGTLTSAAIEAMLKTLDPYTEYIPEGKIEDYRFLSTGEFGGIGASIHSFKNEIIITSVYEDGPAKKAGLKTGDIVKKVNGREFDTKSTEEFDVLIKGDPGSSIILEIYRPYYDKKMDITIVREKIKLKNVSYSAMLSDQIGYIRLERFAEKAAADFGQALNQLREKKPTSLIIDLRGNGGGLLNEAVSILSYFVSKGTYIVSTKSRESINDRTYYTLTNPIEPELPLLILVDENSASASEILAGAIQDLDRGIVYGNQTFGKGLVQNVIPLAYKAQLKITVAKYYIPSGRCIQRIVYNHEPGNPITHTVPDSLRHPFKTLNGRIVYDGAGIEPDLSTGMETMPEIIFQILSQMMVFNYATEFAFKNPGIAEPSTFNITDDTYQDFLNFLSKNKFQYDSYLQQQFNALQKDFKDAGIDADEAMEQLKVLLENHKETSFEKYKTQLMRMIQSEIVSRYYTEDGRIRNFLKSDPELEKALNIMAKPELYQQVINGTHPDSKSKKASL